jgi:hypothetical protein
MLLCSKLPCLGGDQQTFYKVLFHQKCLEDRSSTRRPMLQRHLVAKLLLICNIEKMTENALPSICQKIINLQPLLCSSLKN